MFNYNWGFDWLGGGLIKLLVIIATLQIVKKIPDLINSIFGTQIKDQGGIKGRLGEMAGIGGLAQRAWTSLGTGARNLAKAGLIAPAAAGYKIADKMYFDKKGKKLSDNKVMRQAMGLKSGISTAWKTGSPIKAYEAYDKGTAAPSYMASERISAQGIRNKQMIDKVNSAVAYTTPDGKRFNVLDENGNWVNQFKDPKTGKDVFVPESVMNSAKEMYYKELERQGTAGKLAAAKMRAQDNQMQAEGLQKKAEAAKQFLADAADDYRTAKDIASANKCDEIAGKIRDGKTISQADKAWLIEQGKSIQKMKDAYAQISKIENESIILRSRIPGYDGNTGDIALGTFIGQQKNIVEGYSKKYDQAITTMSEVDKDYLSSLQGVITNSNPIINGALQNNADIMSIFNEPLVVNGEVQKNQDGTPKMKYTNLKLNDKGEYTADVVVNGTVTNRVLTESEISPVITNYVGSIKTGVVKASNTDYDIDVVTYNRLVDNVSKNTRAGSLAYYAELHDQILTDPNITQPTKDRVTTLEESGFLPNTMTADDYGIKENDFDSYATEAEKKYAKGSKEYYKEIHENIVKNNASKNEVINRANKIKRILRF